MTLPEWITRYANRAEPFIPLPNFLTYFEPSKGFFLYAQFGNVFEIDHTCTNDGQYMAEVSNQMAKDRGCTIIRTATFRSPAPYMRMFKCTPNLTLSGIRPNGKMYWVFERKVQ